MQRAAPPSPAGSRAALRCRLNLGLFRCSPPPPAVPACPGPRALPPCAFSSPCRIGWIVSEQKAALLFPRGSSLEWLCIPGHFLRFSRGHLAASRIPAGLVSERGGPVWRSGRESLQA